MSKWLICLSLLLSTGMVHAHQADISSTMLIEQEDNSWVLQIRAALTAFQYQVGSQHSDNTYETPEEFQQLVIDHLKKNLTIYFNENETVDLDDAYVKLGHETSVVFKLSGIPQTIESVFVKNSSFQNIHRNQSALIVLKKGFAKKQFVLKEANEHSALLLVDGTQFVQYAEANGNKSISTVFLVVGLFVLFIGAGFVYRINKQDVGERNNVKNQVSNSIKI